MSRTNTDIAADLRNLAQVVHNCSELASRHADEYTECAEVWQDLVAVEKRMVILADELRLTRCPQCGGEVHSFGAALTVLGLPPIDRHFCKECGWAGEP